MSVDFAISAWRAWAPGLVDPDDWSRWRGGEVDVAGRGVAGEDRADVSFLPAMQRRRLSPLAKAAFAAAYPLFDDRDLPLLCCSVHGEARRTWSLLNDVAAGEDLSPTAFGLSVHNAIAGQLSILRDIRSPALALAGGDLPLQTGFLEAAGTLSEGARELVLLFCEEPLPDLYRPSARSPSHICATALSLRAVPEEGGMRCTLARGDRDGPTDTLKSAFDSADYQLPLIAALVDGHGSLPLGQGWEVRIHG